MSTSQLQAHGLALEIYVRISKPGTLLTPEFGRRMLDWVIYTKDGFAPGAINALLNMTWEVVRLHEFAQCPSRLKCLYLWEAEERARDFASRRPHPAELYEVEVTECSCVFIADMNLISYFAQPETLASLMERARRYWTAANVSVPEVLLEGAVRVVTSLGCVT